MQFVRVLVLFTLTLIGISAGAGSTHPVAAADLLQVETIQPPTVEPPDGYPGTEFRFTANGFDTRERVSFWANAPDGSVQSGPGYSVNATTSGHAEWTWLAPTDAMSGQWSMVAEGVQSQVQQVILFEINDGTAIDPDTGFTVLPDPSRRGVEPASGVPGTQFHFFAGNFRQNEMVSFWVNDPTGRVFGDESYHVRADGQGFVDWLWVSSHNDRTGIWSMVAVGQESSVVQIIPFEIE